MEDLFESSSWNFDIKKEHISNKGEYVVTAGLTNRWILWKTNIKAKIFDEKTITIDMFWFAFYRNFKYKMVTHARVFSLNPKFKISDNQWLFLANSFHFMNWYFGYEKMCTWQKIKEKEISLPIKNWKIDFDFMESFIEGLEKEKIEKLEKYLEENWLKDCELTSEEKKVLSDFESGKIEWREYNLEKLFWKSTRGRRLKSSDRISWDLPFVTAGETDEGISAFIWNDINIFSENTTTIDMFGSAKYRNYKYWWDDHIAVVHTNKLQKLASIFVTTAIHKTSYNWQFNYGKNFYAKDADELKIQLPIKNNNPDYGIMEVLISGVQKMVVKSMVEYVEGKI